MDEIEVRVHEAWNDGAAIRVFDLRSVEGETLPGFTAGSHVNVNLGNGLTRQYSLLNDPSETHRYVIAVALDPQSRGGSRYMMESIAPQDVLTISTPRSHFALTESAAHSVLLAGGIGVTPVWAMVQRLESLGKSWALHYGARSPQDAALVPPMRALAERGRDVRFYFQSEGDAMMDMAAIVATAPAGTHFYCCGPAGMLTAFKEATAGLPPDNVHFEQFTPAAPAAVEGGFTVELAKSGKSLDIAHGQSILDALLANGLRVPYSCREGVCGECETVVLEGVPDHRDAILSDDEKASGKTMMICCSGSLSSKLVLDR